jgi:4-amino-4-deoxy-L-arabinose transferase-like glycosyltransferase
MSRHPRHKKSRKSKIPLAKPAWAERYGYVLLVILLALTALLRLRLLGVPLERDEGEYALFGQLMLRGIPPYEAVYSMKFPGTHFLYALIMLFFGQTATGIHLGLLMVNAATITFLYLLMRRLTTTSAALFAAIVFALLSVSPTVLGFAGHATHFVVLMVMAGLWLLQISLQNKKVLWMFAAGVLVGAALLMKQSGVFFSFFGAASIVIWTIINDKGNLRHFVRNMSLYFAGGIIPIVITSMLLLYWDVWERFWFWAIEYSFSYTEQVPAGRAWRHLIDNSIYVMEGWVAVWIVAAAGIVVLFIDKRFRLRRFSRYYLLLFLVFSLLSLAPGFYFRPHYYVMLLPAIAVLTGVALDYFAWVGSRKWMSVLSGVLLLVVISIGIHHHRYYFFENTPAEISRNIYGLNPFPESEAIGDFIKKNSYPGDTMAVIGSEPQLYFYSGLMPATGYIYTYPLMELHPYNQQMQKEMIAEVEATYPQILVHVNIDKTWLRKPDSPLDIFYWMGQYAAANYQLIGTVEIYQNTTVYKFSSKALTDTRKAPFRVMIYKRKV